MVTGRGGEGEEGVDGVGIAGGNRGNREGKRWKNPEGVEVGDVDVGGVVVCDWLYLRGDEVGDGG